jgi:Na+-translocating ferredoxin:NAD+ oxidoreductase RnfG subunit
VWAAGSAAAQVLLTQEEALELAFGADARMERRTAFLTDDQIERVRELVGGDAEVEQHVVSYYVAMRPGGTVPAGVAYFDAHRVRTLPEVLMVAVDGEGRVSRIEVLKFSEPPDYLAPEGWLAQFDGRGLDDGLSLKGDIVTMTGATLTSKAVTGAVRRALALHRVLRPLDAGATGTPEPRGP